MNDLNNTIFHSTRDFENSIVNDYTCQLETPGNIYYWNMEYSTTDAVLLHEVNDEGAMLMLIEEKLAEIVGEPVVSLSPLRWENRWYALSFTDPSSVLQLKVEFDPVSVEEQEGGSKRVGTGSFTVKTTVPAKNVE